MFCPNYDQEELEELADQIVDQGLMEPSRPLPDSSDSKLAKGQVIYSCLQSYFGTIEMGYLQLLDEVKAKWGEIRLPEFTLSPASLEKLKDLVKFQQIAKDSTLQTYLHWPDSLMLEAFTLATNLQERREWNKAIALLVFLLYLNPYLTGLWQSLGSCWEQENQAEAAQFAYQSAINCEPSNIEVYRDACRYLIEQRDYSNAESLLQYGLEQLSQEPQDDENATKKTVINALLSYIQSLKIA